MRRVPSGRSRVLPLLVALALVAGCESTAAPSVSPSGGPGSDAPASPASPSASPWSPSPESGHSASAIPSGLAPGAIAVTVADRVRVRSAPRVADDSARLTPLLPARSRLLVLDGPVEGSRYTWFRVAPLDLTLDGARDGWVAIGDHDGTPWVAVSEPAPPGIELASASSDRAPAGIADARRGAASGNALAVDLYRRLALGSGGNLVFSSTSIQYALAMARAGARGETAAQMDAVLNGAGWADLSSGLNGLDTWLSSLAGSWADEGGVPHQLSLSLANAAFAQRDLPLEPAYLESISSQLGAGLGLTDFVADADAARRAINAWVARQTAGRIPQLLRPPNVTPATRLVLVNAVYLKASWLVPFPADATADAAFTTAAGSRVRVPTMILLGGQAVPLASGRGWTATELPYRGRDGVPLAMLLVRPDDLATFEADLTTDRIGTIVRALDGERAALSAVSDTVTGQDGDCPTYPYQVRLFLPRFGVETRLDDMAGILAELGMPDAFDAARADFSGITGARDLSIGAVVHEANIDVDEAGTEAAAATAIGMDVTGCGIAPGETRTLRIDRPFLFAVRDMTTGAILFLGRVADPSTRA